MITVLLLATALDLDCLAKNIYHEARGEPIDGQIAVAEVTLNRVLDSKFPSSVCGVVYQPSQFSWTLKEPPIKNKKAFKRIKRLVNELVTGETEFLGVNAVFYHSVKVEPYWAEHFTKEGQIGNHIFYSR